MIASRLGGTFNNWVKEQVDVRHQKVVVKKDLMIAMDPEIAKIFKESNAVSSKSVKSSLVNFFFSFYSE